MVAGPASWGTENGGTLLTAFSAAVPPERICEREENRQGGVPQKLQKSTCVFYPERKIKKYILLINP